jgi:glycosyltransferase involved in cell wall biosynthesis
VNVFPQLKVLREERRGKGLAVKRGMLEATGQYRFICDVDLSMPIEEVSRFIPPNSDNDITIASREAPGAKRYNEPEYRHFIGRIFNFIVRVMAIPGYHDTQCGFKCFSAKAAEELFPYQTINGWTFDVEILYVARKLGYKIFELGIPWYHDPHSKVKVFKDSFQMMLDLIKIRLNNLRGTYAKKV